VFKQSAKKIGMPAVWILAIAIVGVAAIAGSSHLRALSARTLTANVPAVQSGRARADLDALPLAFEANQGQTDPQVKYMARGKGYTAFLTADETVFAMQASRANAGITGNGALLSAQKTDTAPTGETAAIRMKLVGANENAPIAAENELPGHSNYFIGNDRSKWHAGVKQYARVSYKQVYPGVNLAFHGQQKQLEFDFIVAPGADPKSIRFDVDGAKKISTDSTGNLVLSSVAGDVVLHKPVTYQRTENAQHAVGSRFVVAKNTVSFEVGSYDRSRELVIDPSVSYATYLGGNAEDDAYAITVNSAGNAYVTGQTKSTNFPTANALHATGAGGFDVFVSELSATGSSLIFSTYIGGSADDSGTAIALDGSDNIFVAGGTGSSNFPTQGALQATFGGVLDGFVLELNPGGSALTYSTFLGGNASDVVSGLALDSSANAYVVGSTSSTDFPTHNPLQTNIAGTSNGFVAKVNASGNALDYSTYLGGGSGDFAIAVAVDGSGQAYVTGGTKNPTFPTHNPLQRSCGTAANCNGGLYDIFVTVYNAAGSAYVYSTFLGGEGNDEGFGIALDSSKNAYITGLTSSTAFPTKTPIQGTLGGGSLPADAFVTEINATGSALVYSTYLGGSGNDTGIGIAVDGNKNAYVTGQTSSANFPTMSPTQPTKARLNDAFVTEVNAAGSAYVFSTYLGGSLNEDTSAASGGGAIGAIAVDGAGSNIYVTGNTLSTDFPTVSPEQGTAGALGDAFVAKFGTGTSNANFTITNGALSPTSGHAGVSANATITVTSTAGFSSAVALTCSVSPAVTKGPTCSLNPASVTPPANSTVTSTLTVSTAAAAARLENPFDGRDGVLFATIVPVFGLTLVGAGMGSSDSRRKKLFGLFLLGMLAMTLMLMPGCSSSSTTVGGGGGGTPAGAYTITVTGTSGGASATGAPAITLTIN
jgi:hypothetical protein